MIANFPKRRPIERRKKSPKGSVRSEEGEMGLAVEVGAGGFSFPESFSVSPFPFSLFSRHRESPPPFSSTRRQHMQRGEGGDHPPAATFPRRETESGGLWRQLHANLIAIKYREPEEEGEGGRRLFLPPLSE